MARLRRLSSTVRGGPPRSPASRHRGRVRLAATRSPGVLGRDAASRGAVITRQVPRRAPPRLANPALYLHPGDYGRVSPSSAGGGFVSGHELEREGTRRGASATRERAALFGRHARSGSATLALHWARTVPRMRYSGPTSNRRKARSQRHSAALGHPAVVAGAVFLRRAVLWRRAPPRAVGPAPLCATGRVVTLAAGPSRGGPSVLPKDRATP